MRHLRSMLTAGLMALPIWAKADEVVLKSVSTWPSSYLVVKEYLHFIDQVNERGKGIIRIQHLGGPEIVPPDQQDIAIRNGVFDIQYGAASYYSGTVPEADALKAAEISPVQARERGVTARLSQIWRQRLNAEVLAWMSGGVGFHLYLAEPPKMTEEGLPDLQGIKLRSASAYKDWFESMGAVNVMMTPGETFSAFERGMVQGLATTGLNFRDMGITEQIKTRVDPPIWQIDTLIIMNADRFDSLPPEARQILTEVAVEQEKLTTAAFQKLNEEETAEITAKGVSLLELSPEAARLYKSRAHDLVWARLEKTAAKDASELREALSE